MTNIKDHILTFEIKENEDKAKVIYNKLNIIGSNPDAIAFIMVIFKYLFKGITSNELESSITDGRDDMNIDAILIKKDVINIFDVSKEDPTETNLIALEKSISDNILNIPKDYNAFNSRLSNKLKTIHKSNKKFKIRLYVVRKSSWKETDFMKKSIKKTVQNIEGSEFNYLNTDSLVNLMVEREDYLPKWEFICKSSWTLMNEDKDEGIFLISISDLLDLQHQCKMSEKDLFSKNIRIFLNKKSLIGDIIKTLKNEPEKFHIYHNGIVMTTSGNLNILCSGKFEVIQPQIINGAQTINCMYEEFKDDLKNKSLKTAKILCKIIKANSDLTNKICQTSNSQIPIKAWDLRSNDDIHIYMEKLLAGFGYKYIRKGGSSSNSSILMPKFIQWVYSSFFYKPADAKNDKKSLFNNEELCNKIYTKLKESTPHEINRLCEIGLDVENKAKKANKNDRTLIRDADFHIISMMYIKKIKFEKVLSKIEDFVKAKKKGEPGITNNKIFTKSTEVFNYLNGNL